MTIIADLNAWIGPTVTSLMAGAPSAESATLWETTGVPEGHVERLAVAHEVFQTIAAVEGEDTTRAWFLGRNPRLGGAPALAIRDGRFGSVRKAAQAMVEDAWD